MKRILSLFAGVVVLLSAAACGSSNSGAVRHAQIEIVDYGTIEVELYADMAPKTVENFISLAKSGFYDGLTFHRMQEGFVLQGGDPNGNGTGSSGKTIQGEFLKNGFTDNTLSHTTGVLSMARGNDLNSASCQFFIVLDDSAKTSLDGLYAGFGKVTDGMDIIEQIAKDVAPYAVDSMGSLPKANQPVIKTVKILD